MKFGENAEGEVFGGVLLFFKYHFLEKNGVSLKKVIVTSFTSLFIFIHIGADKILEITLSIYANKILLNIPNSAKIKQMDEVMPFVLRNIRMDDCLEITSLGGLLPGVTIELMKEGFSKIRND